MVSDLILTVLVLFGGAFVSFVISPFFGIKFFRDDSTTQHGEDLNSNVSMWDFIKCFPAWLWLLSLLIFQACIVFTLNLWWPSLFDGFNWILSFSRFLLFFAVILYVTLVNVTDDFGKIKWFRKKK